MAYANQSSPRSRAISMGAVVSIQALVCYALVSGLAYEYSPHGDRNLPTTVIHTDPPQPTKPTPHSDTHPSTPPLTSPVPQLTLPHTVELPPSPTPTLSPSESPYIAPRPTPSAASFAPKEPRALGNPASWVSTDDYPAGDLREEHAGVTRFILAISAGGQVNSCVVTRSSGWAGLDAATCQLIARRAHFAPATDDTGAHVAGSYSGSIRWEIPQ